MQVLIFLNSISHTSVPFELSVRIAKSTDIEIVVASFYDENSTNVDIDQDIADLPLEIRYIGGDSRFDYNAWREIEHELSKGYDLVHTHHNFSGSVMRILAKQKGIPVVNTEHRPHDSFSLLQNLVNAPTLPIANCVISNSQATEDSFQWYEQLILNEKKLRVIYNGVNIERIQMIIDREEYSSGDKTFRICTVGRMVPVKNQSVLIHAFSSVIEQKPHAELVLVGDGPLRDDLKSIAHDQNLLDSIQFTGKVPRTRVYELYAQSDVFVIPSSAEGFCVAAVEAMAAGLPVVASDIPVFHEVIGESGLYADPKDAKMFSNHLVNLDDNKSYREAKADSCYKRAKQKFNLDETAEKYYNLYEEFADYSSSN